MKKHTPKQDRYDSKKAAPKRRTTIGGQALIEGLLMIGPDRRAMAVRKTDGTILIEELAAGKALKLAKIPFLRGSVMLFRQLITGTSALLRSAEIAEIEEAEISRTEAIEKAAARLEQVGSPESVQPVQASESKSGSWFDRFAERHSQLMLYGSVVIGILFSVSLFILLPNFLAGLISQWTGLTPANRSGTIMLNLLEGAIRIVLFVLYLAFSSRMKDIRRVWQYHGAEHKTIACYEAEKDLTVENVRMYSRFHPRCGTAFLFIVILVSIIVFSLIGWWSRWINLLVRFALVPVIAGISYEIIRLAGRNDNLVTRIMLAPGLWLQRLTTAEPDDSMLEVAIAAMDAVKPQRAFSDRW